MESLKSFTSSTLSHWSLPSYDERLHSLADLKDPERFKLPFESYLRRRKIMLPDVDRGYSTRLSCVLGLGATWISIFACFTGGTLIIATQGGLCVYPTSLSVMSGRATSFAINIALALLTDALGYIHMISLRWALFREGRLYFNNNIRLFNSAHNSLPNWWPANLVNIASLILCYAATSQIFIRGKVSNTTESSTEITERIFINGVAVLALGLGLFFQAAISTWCLIKDSRSIPAWSSNPLTNTLAYMHEGLPHRAGRCMLSVNESRLMYPKAMEPSAKQYSAKSATRSVLYVIVFVWILAFLIFIWALALVLACRNAVLRTGQAFKLSTSWTPIWNSPGEAANQASFSTSFHGIAFAAQIVLGIMFTCASQGTQTVSLHCIELIVNMSRDEDVWRQAYIHGKGAPVASHGLLSAITSWPNLVLFFSKAVLHWLIGQSLMVSFTSTGNSNGRYIFEMIYMRVLIYGIVATVLAIFATYLAFRKPNGCIPAAWGHFQTLADLIDDWNVDPGGRMWWGDKGETNGVRHAGTGMRKAELGDIVMGAVYAGRSRP